MIDVKKEIDEIVRQLKRSGGVVEDFDTFSSDIEKLCSRVRAEEESMTKALAEAVQMQLESSGNCTCGGCVRGRNILEAYRASKAKVEVKRED